MKKEALLKTFEELNERSFNENKRNTEDLYQLMSDLSENNISKSDYKERNDAIQVRIKDHRNLVKEIKQIAKQIHSH